ncbi:MAG: hypothetical protein IPF77_03890 [Gemmatimonadetes bacterium]|nr:hypothetical protein [Gemmatimonadota bacterium]
MSVAATPVIRAWKTRMKPSSQSNWPLPLTSIGMNSMRTLGVRVLPVPIEGVMS